MPVLRLFAAAREAAGEARIELDGRTVAEVLDQARARYGEGFASVLQRSRVWLNGQPADPGTTLGTHDVVAVLPPVSGGAGALATPPAPPAPAMPASSATPVTPATPAAESLVQPSAPPAVPPPPPALGPEEPAVPLVSDPLSPIAPSPSPELAAEQRMTDPWGPWPDTELGRYPTPSLGLPPPPEPRREPAPSTQSSPEDLLDRLAGMTPFSDDPLFGEADEPEEEDRSEKAPEPDLDPDLAGWGPASGPVWSLGTHQPPPAPPLPVDPERDLWKWPDAPGAPLAAPDPPPAPPETASPFAPPPPPGSDWDRRWDAPLLDPEPAERRDEEGGSAPVSPPERPPGEASDSAEPAVPILRPVETDGGPPTAPVQIFDQPAVRILGGERAGRSTSGSKAATLVVDGPEAHQGSSNAPTGATVAPSQSRSSMAAPAAPAMAPEPAAAKQRRKAPPLAVIITANRPHGRLGMLWVGITVGAVFAGSAAAAVWLAVCAGVAGLQTAKVWRARNEKPLQPLAASIAAVLPLSAIWGLRAMTAVVAAAVVLALLARLFSVTKAPARDVGLTLAIGVVIGLAVASVVLLRNIDVHAPLLLLAFAAAYDAGAYLVGTGASSAWEGPAAGVAALIPVTMLSAVILVPPFRAGGPLLLGLIAAILAPCGPLAGSALLGERDANAPALRRLDSLLVLGPAWAWCAAALLR